MLFATAFLRAVCECEGGLPGAGRSPTGSAGSFGLRFATEGLTGTDRARRRALQRAVKGCRPRAMGPVSRADCHSLCRQTGNCRDGKPEGKAEGMTDSERSADPKGGIAYGIPININLSMP